MERVPGSNRRGPKDRGGLLDRRGLLDEALDDRGQRRKFEKCEGAGEEFYYL